MKQPPRAPWREFPNVVLLAAESRTKPHPQYRAAKSGDTAAAAALVRELVEEAGIVSVRRLIDGASRDAAPVLISVHAYESEGVNAIPVALAGLLEQRFGMECEDRVVQSNVVSHTGADGYSRLARQATFGGEVTPEREYVMIDDFVGQGGTLANLRGWIETRGGTVIGAVSLTGKTYSARLNPSLEQLHEIEQKHGPAFEQWWRERFGHAFDCLTQSEARYLARATDVDTIRNRIAAAQQEGNGPDGA